MARPVAASAAWQVAAHASANAVMTAAPRAARHALRAPAAGRARVVRLLRSLPSRGARAASVSYPCAAPAGCEVRQHAVLITHLHFATGGGSIRLPLDTGLRVRTQQEPPARHRRGWRPERSPRQPVKIPGCAAEGLPARLVTASVVSTLLFKKLQPIGVGAWLRPAGGGARALLLVGQKIECLHEAGERVSAVAAAREGGGGWLGLVFRQFLRAETH